MQEWLESVGVGVPGYVTPKVAIGAIVGNDAGELLLVQRADSGHLAVPDRVGRRRLLAGRGRRQGGAEETGIECEPQRVLAVIDGQRMGFSRFGDVHAPLPLHGDGRRAALPPAGVRRRRVVRPEDLPATTAGAAWWAPMAFAAINGEDFPTVFDAVRSPIWRA